ncbi:MAG: LexA family transcriptional regulator [Clostridia bacterium]|nr:LexA family transcriptional regulator [Clostridia bacterium]
MSDQKPKKKQISQTGRPVVDKERRSHVGQIIRKYRTDAGMDQAVLASRLGFTKTAVGNWELGLTRPDIDTIPRLCEVLRIPVTELLGIPQETALPFDDRCVLDTYHQLDRFNRRTVTQMMDRLLFQQDTREKERLRGTYRGLCLYEEAAAAGIGALMPDYAESKTIFAPKAKIPGGADCVIHVNGTSMEPTFPNGSYVYVNSEQEVSPGQIGIFIVNSEAFIKEYQPEGLVSHNKRYKTIRIGEETEVRCCGRVTGIVEDGDIASGALLEKIETAFEEEET